MGISGVVLMLGAAGLGVWWLLRDSEKSPDPVQRVGFTGPVYAPGGWSPPAKAAPYLAAFERAERANGLPRHLLARMAQQESNYDPAARGLAGEVGLMQITPRWHPGVNARDPFESISYAGDLMRRHYARFGSWSHAIAAYNWGPTNLARKGLSSAPLITRNYISEVLGDIGQA